MADATQEGYSNCSLGKEWLVGFSLPWRLVLEGLRRHPHFDREPPVIETEPCPPVRAIVASFLFTDLVGFSKGTASEQYAAKAALSACLRRNLAVLRETDYWIKDTGDGALIAFVSNPEHALYMALAIAQDYRHTADGRDIPFDGLRTGLHLGTVKETVDLEARPNYIGDGINATKRIMDFAIPGQIAASRNFFDAVASLDKEYAGLFRHLGAPDDKHGRAHELYAIAPSAGVLQKLKFSLMAAAPRSAEFDAKSIATVDVQRDSSMVDSTEFRTPSIRVAEAVRIGFNHLIVLIFLIASAVALFLIIRRPGPAAPTVDSVTNQTVAIPLSTKEPAASLTAAGEPAAISSTSSAAAPRLDEAAPMGTTYPAQGAAINALTPVVIAPPAAQEPNVESTRRSTATPGVPVRVQVAPDRSSLRCSLILEKAELGEPLSQEEKKELGNTCR